MLETLSTKALFTRLRAMFFPAPVQSDHLRRHARRAATLQTRNPALCPLHSLQGDPSAHGLGYVDISLVLYKGYPEMELMTT